MCIQTAQQLRSKIQTYKAATCTCEDSSVTTVASSGLTVASASLSYDSERSTTTSSYKKIVSFDECVRARFTISRDHYSQEEIHAAWYSREENKRIMQRCQKLVAFMERGGLLKDTSKHCFRGLEGYTMKGSKMKKFNRDAAYRAVCEAQLAVEEKKSNTSQKEIGRCSEEGNFDDEEELIAKSYSNATSSCQLWANNVGRHDHIDAEDCLLDICDY